MAFASSHASAPLPAAVAAPMRASDAASSRVRDIDRFFTDRRKQYPSARARAAVHLATVKAERERRGNRPQWVAVARTSAVGTAGAPRVSRQQLDPSVSSVLLRVGRDAHERVVPSAKSEAALYWGTSRAPGAASVFRSAPQGAHLPLDVEWNMFTPVSRREQFGVTSWRNATATRHEATLSQRRAADASAHTLDNQYRQLLAADGKPLMNMLLKDPSPADAVNPLGHTRAARRAASLGGRGRPHGRGIALGGASQWAGGRSAMCGDAIDHIADNRRQVHERSGTVAAARASGVLPARCPCPWPAMPSRSSSAGPRPRTAPLDTVIHR